MGLTAEFILGQELMKLATGEYPIATPSSLSLYPGRCPYSLEDVHGSKHRELSP